MKAQGRVGVERGHHRIMIVGCGSIGRRHVRNLRSLGETDLLAFRSRRGSPECTMSDGEVRSHFDLGEALGERPDIAVIANPTSLHLPVALAAAQKGCHLFLEKPISHSLEGTDELLAELRERELVAAVGYNLRFHPALQIVRELCRQREIGEILAVRAWAGQYLPDWHPGEDYRSSYMASADLGGGVILTLSHELDYLFWLFGDVMEVSAVTGRAHTLEISTESLAEVTITFRSGLLGHVHLDCLRRSPGRGCELVGTDGTIQLDLVKSSIKIFRPGSRAEEVIEIPLPDPNQMYIDEMADFLAAIETSRPPRVPFQEGLAVLRLALAARRAAETGVRQSCQ